jgi:hypothetical protein
MSSYVVFNRSVLALIKEVGAVARGSASHLAAMEDFYRMAMKTNARLPFNKFLECVMAPYGERLRRHDDAFFLEEVDVSPGGAAVGDIVAVLRGAWRGMDAGGRARVLAGIDRVLEAADRVVGEAVAADRAQA